MKPKHFTQRMYLFFFYGLLILILLCLFFTYFYLYYSKNVFEGAKKDAENMCTSLTNSMQAELDAMSTISMNIVYSNAIRNNFTEFARTYHRDQIQAEDFSDSRNSSLAIYDIITSIIGPFQSATQVNLYTNNGDCVGSGYFQRITHVKMTDLPWYLPTKALNGHKYMTKPMFQEDYPAKGGNTNSHKFLSMTRVFFNQDQENDGIVEVIQDCGKVFALADQLQHTNQTSGIYIYNNRQELVYPYQNQSTASDQEDYLALIAKEGLTPLSGTMVPTDSEGQMLLTYNRLENYDWTILTAVPKQAVYNSLTAFRNSFLVILSAAILFTLFVCFLISSRLTNPLSRLTKAAHRLTMDRVLDSEKPLLTSADSTITEISQLCESFRDMYDKLKTSSQEILLARSEETKAKLQATQSLINPHFLYNSLTTISILAEENMDTAIIRICQSLCDYFRYISASSEMVVPLSKEILYTEKYISCMQIRFEEDFSYTSTIRKDVQNVLIPKLIVQPIVENAFKYAFNTAPPWTLSIHAYLQGPNWMIQITDNGGTMTEERKEELLLHYQTLDKQKELASMEIGQMGLKNVYLRLHLLYGEDAVFQIDTSIAGQTTFSLGGPVTMTDQSPLERIPPHDNEHAV